MQIHRKLINKTDCLDNQNSEIMNISIPLEFKVYINEESIFSFWPEMKNYLLCQISVSFK